MRALPTSLHKVLLEAAAHSFRWAVKLQPRAATGAGGTRRWLNAEGALGTRAPPEFRATPRSFNAGPTSSGS